MTPFVRLRPTPASIRADVLSLCFIALPVALLGYLVLATTWGHALLVDRLLHGAVVGATVAIALGLGTAALVAHLRGGEAVSLALGVGLLLHGGVHVWSAVFNGDAPAFKALAYGTAAQLLFACSILGFSSRATYAPRARRRNVALAVGGAAAASVLAYALGGVVADFGAHADRASVEGLRAASEFAGAFVAAAAGSVMLLADRGPSRRASVTLFIGIGFLLQRSIFVLLGGAWTVLWWAGHAVGLAGLVLVAWSVLVVHQDAVRTAQIERLVEHDRARTRVLSSAAHELGTPLTPIRVQIHMLRSRMLGPLNERQTRSLEILERNVVQLCSLVDDILDASRLQANRLAMRPTRVDLTALAEEAVEAFRAQAAERRVALERVAGPPIPLDADARRVTQVLFNLLSNAMKFTPAGGRVVVEVAVVDGVATVRVRDDGKGMRPEAVARLFEPFTQVHDAAPDGPRGSGLGLYICRGIVEAHGGRIWCETEGPGRGATFSFTLPLPGAERKGPPRPEAERATA